MPPSSSTTPHVVIGAQKHSRTCGIELIDVPQRRKRQRRSGGGQGGRGSSGGGKEDGSGCDSVADRRQRVRHERNNNGACSLMNKKGVVKSKRDQK
jgi:hypothetical protein